jgi:hypothetical protein
MIHAQVQYQPATFAQSEEMHRAAYNSAFCELGLRWRWDATTYHNLLRIPGEKDRICAYVEQHQPHLLSAYQIGFLSDLIYKTKRRCHEELSQWPARVRWSSDFEGASFPFIAGEAA